MKFSGIFASFAALPALTLALTVSFDQVYDNPSGALTSVACSDGQNGLITRFGFQKFSDLPTFPNIGGGPTIAGWNSTSCGACFQLTFTNAQGVSKSVNVTTLDVSTPTSFNIALASMNTLTGNQAQQLGRVTITSVQLPASACGLH